VPPAQIPAGLDARAGRFRSLLAGRRVQVVLDNARDVGQVRPLLPGSPGCTIVVTSRDRLSGLLRTEGAHPVVLDLLTADDARDLLVRYIGRDRATAEPAAVGEIVERCDRLPLALTVVAARAAENPRFRLAALSDELRGHANRLDALAGDDPDGVRTAFSWSYRALSPAAADLFRLLGLHPGPDISAAAAASLAGLAPARTRPLLAELTRTCLVVEHQPGRYTLHDLLRAYAAERAADGPEPWRRSAVHRLLDHYLHTARAAALLLDVYRDPVDVADPGPGVLPDLPADHGAAIAWFTAERPVLLAAIRLATDSGFDHHVWRLVWSCGVHLYRQGRWDGFAAMCHLALAASQRLADPVAEAHARVELGFAYAHLHHPDAQHHARRALELFTRLGDHRGQASCHLDLSWFLDRCGRHGEAFGHALRALALYRSEGDLVGEARALNGVGFCHARLGDHRAIEHCEHALALHQQLDDTEGEAQTWDSLGYAHHRLGRHSAAVNCYRAALRLFRENGNRYHEADVLRRLGDSLHAVGDADGALDAWHSALHLLEELEHPDADRLRARMPQT
jgi:tetratricopeptide (TPR) repeat protein